MKSFFSLLQKHVLDGRSWDTREQVRHRGLDRTNLLPPPCTPGSVESIECEAIMTASASRAAWPNLSPDH
jgi:hypothetical protein